MVPAEVLTWVRDVFGSCNRAVTAQLSNNPNAAEESFDHAWIAHLNGYATPRRLGNGWTVKIETHFLGGMRHFRRWEIADIGILLFIRDPLRVATRHEFPTKFVADAEARNGCRVRLIRGYS